jgi:DNA-binding NtrC family response regulator
MMQHDIFVVDDEESIRDAAMLTFGGHYNISVFTDAESALATLEVRMPDLVLLDIGLPGMNGIDALRKIKAFSPDICVIMITAYEEIDSVVSAMRLGAYDYVIKPFQMEVLKTSIANAFHSIRLRKEVQALQEHYLKENIPCFIAESDAIQGVMEFVGRVARSPDTPVLILGETGTGKELIARAIHFKSPNFKGPFVALNCPSIPKDLIESELFGYEKGAFSGASTSGKRGLVEESSGGSLFLDEIADLSLESQAKLLRFLESGEFYRLGGTRKMTVKARIIAATNKDPLSLIERGAFREDLYHRLAVVTVRVPTLNERPEDIIPIAKYFLCEFARKLGKTFTGISTEAESALTRHEWRGNVRELKNVIEREVLTGAGPLLTLVHWKERKDSPPVGPTSTAGMPPFPPLPPGGLDVMGLLEDVRRHYFKEAIRVSGGNLSEAARLLNLGYYSFRRHKEKLGL